jgi:hypothetical protein
LIIDDIAIEVRGKRIKIGLINPMWYFYIENPESIIEKLKALDNKPDLFSFIQEPGDTEPRYPYPYERSNLAVIAVKSYDYWWSKQIQSNGKRNVKKSRKRGVEIKVEPYTDEVVRGIHSIYNETPLRQRRKFWHYGKSLEQVRKENATFQESADYICAYYENEMVGYLKLVYLHQSSGVMQIISMAKHRNLFINNGLIAKAVELSEQKKKKYFIYGNYDYGAKGSDSLTFFKKTNGFLKMDILKYFIPLTPKGKFAYTFKLHKKLIDFIPPFLTNVYRDLRFKFLKMKYNDNEL